MIYEIKPLIDIFLFLQKYEHRTKYWADVCGIGMIQTQIRADPVQYFGYSIFKNKEACVVLS